MIDSIHYVIDATMLVFCIGRKFSPVWRAVVGKALTATAQELDHASRHQPNDSPVWKAVVWKALTAAVKELDHASRHQPNDRAAYPPKQRRKR